MTVTIYHNPACGTSRNTLAMIRNAGIEPTVIEYLSTPPDRLTLQAMIRDAGLTVREAIREKGTPYAELGLADPALADGRLLDAMLAHPILINRPFVVTERPAVVQAVGACAGHPAGAAARRLHQGRRRGRHRRAKAEGPMTADLPNIVPAVLGYARPL